MMDYQKYRVSNQAFIQQIQNWQLTLSRQNRKLKSLRTKISSKIHINQLDILVTSIQGEIIKYRKYKDPKKLEKIDIIEQYNLGSRKFMDLMENIGNFADKADQLICQQNTILDASQIHKQNNVDTSNMNFHKSLYRTNKQKLLEFQPKNTKIKPMTKKSIQGHYTSKNTSLKVSKYRPKTSNNNKSFSRINKNSQQQYDSWQIKYQLKEIKSMMTQIQNQIKYHNHQEIENQLAKIQHNNKKMGLQLKTIREDNNYVMNRIQKLKEELKAEKQIQNQMINQFESPQPRVSFHESRTKKNPQKSYSHNCSQNQDLSEWVKVRI